MEYGQFCPIAKATEVIGEKWTVLIIREALMGSTRYSEFQRGLSLISPTLLSKRLDSLVNHGLLVAGIITEIGGQIGWLASGMDFRYKKPVYFGDTITCIFTITSIDERGRATAEGIFENQNGAVVLKSVITGILPDEAERRILKAMVAEGDPTNKIY